MVPSSMANPAAQRPPPVGERGCANYPAAARRHKRDGDSLYEQERLDNADHLYGFAAECALLGSLCVLHRASVYPELSLDEKGQIQDPDLRRAGHIKEVWSHMIGRVHRLQTRRDILTLFQRFQLHRDGQSREPFRDWRVNDRYLDDGHVSRERVLAHQKAADTCLDVLRAIEQGYLKRAPTKGPPEAP
jgi:hypothetical protein